MKLYGLDLETDDPFLADRGASWVFGQGSVICVGLYDPETGKKDALDGNGGADADLRSEWSDLAGALRGRGRRPSVRPVAERSRPVAGSADQRSADESDQRSAAAPAPFGLPRAPEGGSPGGGGMSLSGSESFPEPLRRFSEPLRRFSEPLRGFPEPLRGFPEWLGEFP